MSKKKIYLITSYIVLLFFSYLYVKNVLKTKEIDTFNEKEEKESTKEYDVNVTLNYFDGKKTMQYARKITNTDSIYSFLQDIRNKEDLPIEFNEYTYGIEIISVQNVASKTGYKWALLKEEQDITTIISSTSIDKDTTLELKMIEK